MIAFCRWSSVPRLRGVCARHQRVQASCALLLPFGCPPNALYYNDLIGDKLPEGPAPDATCRVGATMPGAAIATGPAGDGCQRSAPGRVCVPGSVLFDFTARGPESSRYSYHTANSRRAR